MIRRLRLTEHTDSMRCGIVFSSRTVAKTANIMSRCCSVITTTATTTTTKGNGPCNHNNYNIGNEILERRRRNHNYYNHQRVSWYSSSSSSTTTTASVRGVGRTGGTSTRLLMNQPPPSPPSPTYERLLVIGSGVAGSAAALVAAATYQLPVTVLFAGQVATDCNSNWAQGGIIYRNYDVQSGDSAAVLAADIHRAGAGLCYDPAVRKVAAEGPDRVRQLLLDVPVTTTTSTTTNSTNHHGTFANVPFDRTAHGELALCLEASHAAPRILHTADHSGQTITHHITSAAARHPLITFQPETIVTDLIHVDGVCIGVETIRNGTMRCNEYAAYGTVLAAGGLAGIYEHSTNPAGFNALGSSVAMARRAGVTTQDLEYVQFHPTALCLPGKARFLLTEALRGEGAILRDRNGRAFAKEYHAAGELAPRDIVARAVFSESQKADNNVFLDITHRDAKWLHGRFPTICRHLAENSNLDLARDRLPIIPAAHYTCGGVATDLHGCTDLPGLYAAGEAARTGLHGGNRLASTSLLEGLVFGASVADHVGNSSDASTRALEASRAIAAQLAHPNNSANAAPTKHITLQDGLVNNNNSNHAAIQLLRQLRRVMWEHVGVTRTVSGLNTATTILGDLQHQAEQLFRTARQPSLELAAVRDATCAGYAVALAAQANRCSTGAHCIVAEEESDDEADILTAMQ
jgi:L-aspartate oxidase